MTEQTFSCCPHCSCERLDKPADRHTMECELSGCPQVREPKLDAFEVRVQAAREALAKGDRAFIAFLAGVSEEEVDRMGGLPETFEQWEARWAARNGDTEELCFVFRENFEYAGEKRR